MSFHRNLALLVCRRHISINVVKRVIGRAGDLAGILQSFATVKEGSVYMEMMPVKPERKAQLEEYAQRHGQDAATALDDLLASYFEWEQKHHRASVEAIRRGNDDVTAGLTKTADEVHKAVRQKYGFPG